MCIPTIILIAISHSKPLHENTYSSIVRSTYSSIVRSTYSSIVRSTYSSIVRSTYSSIVRSRSVPQILAQTVQVRETKSTARQTAHRDHGERGWKAETMSYHLQFKTLSTSLSTILYTPKSLRNLVFLLSPRKNAWTQEQGHAACHGDVWGKCTTVSGNPQGTDWLNRCCFDVISMKLRLTNVIDIELTFEPSGKGLRGIYRTF
jgi:hypothetical protein